MIVGVQMKTLRTMTVLGVTACLAQSRGEDLDDPENQGDFRHLAQNFSLFIHYFLFSSMPVALDKPGRVNPYICRDNYKEYLLLTLTKFSP